MVSWETWRAAATSAKVSSRVATCPTPKMISIDCERTGDVPGLAGRPEGELSIALRGLFFKRRRKAGYLYATGRGRRATWGRTAILFPPGCGQAARPRL